MKAARLEALARAKAEKARREREGFHPRTYQEPLWEALQGGVKRAVAVWHRRAGKDKISLQWTVKEAMEKPGVYYHFLPTSTQCRKVLWTGVGSDGKRMLDAFPGWRNPGTGIVSKIRHNEMVIELKSGSIWQGVGSDNYNSVMGTNPRGVVFSEYSLADPAAWQFIRPILAENNGWALFIYTPRGRNHGWKLYDMAKNNDDWFAELLTVNDTHAISINAIAAERSAGMPEEMVQQEFYCSFDAPLVGSYYGDLMMKAEAEKRIGEVKHDPALPVETAHDLGVGDKYAIWWFQRYGASEIRLIDYYEDDGQSLSFYVNLMQEKAKPVSAGGRGFNYSRHVFPHDTKARELGTGKTREETLKTLGVAPDILPLQDVDDGINAVRAILPLCFFDYEHCKKGINALRGYRKEPEPEDKWRDETTPEYKRKPVHDWASHGADAFRYLAMSTKSDPGFWGDLGGPRVAVA